MSAAHLAVVDDEPDITQLLANYLKGHGFRVSQLHDGAALFELMARRRAGCWCCSTSACGDEDGLGDRAQAARALALRPGDRHRPRRRGRQDRRPGGRRRRLRDQAVRPARTGGAHQGGAAPPRAGRSAAAAAPAPAARATLRFAGWSLDTAARTLTGPERREVALTTGEFDLLCTLAKHPGRVLSRDFLLEHTRGREVRPVRPHDRRAGRPAAPQDRGRSREPADHQVGARRRLPVRAAGHRRS